MRTATTLVLCLSALALVAAEPALMAYEWMTDEQKELCRKTKLEWKLATGRVDAEAVDIPGKPFEIVSLRAKPTDKGLIVQADLACTNRRLRAPHERHAYDKWGQGVLWKVNDIASQRFGVSQDQRFLFVNYNGQLWMTLSKPHAVLPLNAPEALRAKARAACLARESINAMLNKLYE